MKLMAQVLRERVTRRCLNKKNLSKCIGLILKKSISTYPTQRMAKVAEDGACFQDYLR